MKNKKKAICIVGPTSSGKTSLSIELSKKFNGEIVSVDSRQIYKGFDIGTGKIPVTGEFNVVKKENNWNINGIDIYGYDLTDANSYFSAFDFYNFIKNVIDKKENLLFFTGGTGFYFDTLLGNKIFSHVEANFELRRELDTFSTEDLFEKLQELNKKRSENIDSKNKRRLIRAIEIELNSNKTSKKEVFEPLLTESLIIGLYSENSFLYDRVDTFVDEIFKNDFIEEVKNLLDKGYRDVPVMKGLNYKTVVDLLDKKTTIEEAKQRIKFDNHSYIRRQLTYFRKMQNIVWVDISKKGFDSEVFMLVESELDE